MFTFVFIMSTRRGRRSKSKDRAKKGDSEKLSSTPSGQRENESNCTRKMRDKSAVNELTIVASPSQNIRNKNLASDKLSKQQKERLLLKQGIDAAKQNIWPPLSPTLKALRQTQLESDKERKKERREEQQQRKSYCENGCVLQLRL